MPVSTSPVPAAASARAVGAIDHRVSVRARHTTVPGPSAGRSRRARPRGRGRPRRGRRPGRCTGQPFVLPAVRREDRGQGTRPRGARGAASGSAASAFNASASTTIGSGHSATSRRTAACVSGVAPEAGPDRDRAEALGVGEHGRRRRRLSRLPPAGRGEGAGDELAAARAMPPRRCPGTPQHDHARAAAGRGVRRPGPARPIMPVDPPTRRRRPTTCAPSDARRGRRRSATSSTCNCAGRSRVASIPMSTTRTRPARARPGSNSSPGFSAAKHTVSCGAHGGDRALRPSCRRPPTGCRPPASARPTSAKRWRDDAPASPSSAPRKPVPNIASIARSARAERATQCRLGDAVGQRRTRRRRHRATGAGARRDRTVGAVVAPAAHRPRPAGRTRRRACATRAGRPRFRPVRRAPPPVCPRAIVRRSASPISAGVTTGCTRVQALQ